MVVHHPGARQSVGDLKRMITQMVTASIQHAAIGRAGLRVYDGGWIRIENGGLSVVGEAVIEGILRGTGDLIWDGPWWLNGPGVIAGDTQGTGQLDWLGRATFDGDVSITKDLDVQAKTRLRGQTTIENDVVVTNDGKILVGDMTIDPSAGSGRVTFANGASVQADDGGVAMVHGNTRVRANSSGARLVHGFNDISVSAGGVNVGGLPTVALGDLPPGVVHVNTAGFLRKT